LLKATVHDAIPAGCVGDYGGGPSVVAMFLALFEAVFFGHGVDDGGAVQEGCGAAEEEE